MSKAVVLLSGGLDSATCLAIAKAEGFLPCAISFRYGQRHTCEIDSARAVAKSQGVAQHIIVDINLRQFGGSALTADVDVPKGRDEAAMSAEIPITYVPARNTIFLSYALAWAEVLEASEIYIGVNAVDYSGYPDCRPEYIDAFTKMAKLATKAAAEGSPLRIQTPLINLTKAQIIQRGTELGVDYGLTTSCYDPVETKACGECDACRLRLRGFAKAGLTDPAVYVAKR